MSDKKCSEEKPADLERTRFSFVRLRRGLSGLAAPQLARRGDASALVQKLRDRFGDEQVFTSEAVLKAHGTDESFHDPVAPDVVFAPRTTEEVSEAMRIAQETQSPVIPFGCGTSLEGHVAALEGGLSIDLSLHMNQVLEVNASDMDCRVQAGITRTALNDFIRDTGLHFSVDPGADASVGGMVATGASGTSAVRYGVMKDNVMGLTCVLADGRIMRTGTRARKSSAGYDLTNLIVGSEGTLACVTEVALRLHGQPESVAAAVCSFPSVRGAVDSVVTALQYGVPLARAEFLCANTLAAVSARSDAISSLGMSTTMPGLFLEFHGSESAVREQVDTMREITSELGMEGEFHFAYAEEDRRKLWKARHEAYWAVQQLRPGCRGSPTDICVPITKLTDFVEETMKDIEATGIPAPLFGHVGDGNFHVILLARPDESQEYLDKIFAFNDRLVQRAIDNEGTCTGEHGIGYGKRRWLEQECGTVAVDTMAAIKHALDPENRMNPGKAI
ncbi:D-2-hydroxyglutarate dehydrogenase, mitochondrial [Hondaea fermentalgiana]|uniref:D-lactate dehydrogenase (cytochrome) n=1 Tax=Hondaea fermentalgiana TaxID=2315210 RepID=A0A2R5GJ26_9STRA|nr:D-2-hydroxyglutarate dehydrogenase, mitochondrial [Hondaea fermentalgiana]|eukprot:GBG30615.1 D-2-hydroxyglutarate dehydrogenase, mitochondrial [Hondaea fermentalgiana]